MIVHDEWGHFKYEKIYLSIDRPALFTGRFDSDTEKNLYVGMMVYSYECDDDTVVNEYYFVGVNEAEVRWLERTEGALKKTFMTRPVLFLHSRRGDTVFEFLWAENDKISSKYLINDKATLSCRR